MDSNLDNFSHKRYNPLTGEWVMVSPHRAKRPWQGQEEDIQEEDRPTHDPNCYLCSGNTRANGEVNPDYKDTFSFVNDFAAIQHEVPSLEDEGELFMVEEEKGICKVICFSPDHSKSLAQMSVDEILKVVKLWKKEYEDLGSKSFIKNVQIFENKGAVMGCSNPHPHGQIWSQSSIPNEVIKKDLKQKEYYFKYSRTLLSDYIQIELKKDERIIFENEDFVVLVPFWAIWPYETMIVPKVNQASILSLDENQERNYAEAISVLTKAYDKIFNCSFPYSSGIHQAPTNGEPNEHWHWHMIFYPPLLRSSTVKKFMVGYEMFGSPQRDITPEAAAKIIKSFVK